MKPKLLCSDLDGTLLSSKSDVSDFTVAMLSKIKDRMRIILVSARMPSGMRYLQERLGITHEPLICYNGALVLDGEKELASVCIELEVLKQIHAVCSSFSTDLGLYYQDEWYVPNTSKRVAKEAKYTKTIPTFQNTKTTLENWEKRGIGAHKIMLMGTKESADALMPVLHNNLGTVVHLYRSNDTLIELAPKSISKLSAINLLLGQDTCLKEVIAFGDNYNDIEMLKHVGYGVAVANGRDEVKVVADAITLANTEDGVAHFIQQHLVI